MSNKNGLTKIEASVATTALSCQISRAQRGPCRLSEATATEIAARSLAAETVVVLTCNPSPRRQTHIPRGLVKGSGNEGLMGGKEADKRHSTHGTSFLTFILRLRQVKQPVFVRRLIS
jgi:hypothetical protein